jgi:hypothetical protein
MVYGHKGVISAQLIITQIMKILDGVIGISESILDLNNFVDMTDSYILQSVKHILKLRNHKNNPYKLLDEEYIELEKLQHKWNTHDLYPCVGILIRPINSDITKLIAQYFNNNEYFIEQHKVGFVSGNKPNPLDSIYIYDTNDYLFKKINNPDYEMEATLINKTDISHTISDIYQERVISIFRKVYDINQLIVDKETFKLLKN